MADNALAQALELSKTPRPTSREVKFMRDWLARPAMGNGFLNDIEHGIWTDTNDFDFVTLCPRPMQRDPFTSLLNGALLDLYHRLWGHKRKVDS